MLLSWLHGFEDTPKNERGINRALWYGPPAIAVGLGILGLGLVLGYVGLAGAVTSASLATLVTMPLFGGVTCAALMTTGATLFGVGFGTYFCARAWVSGAQHKALKTLEP